MRNPVYKEFGHIIKSIKDDGFDITFKKMMGTINKGTLTTVYENSKDNIYIDVNRNDFKSEISEKTINNLYIKDIRFPFNSFSISINGIVYFCYNGFIKGDISKTHVFFIVYIDKKDNKPTYSHTPINKKISSLDTSLFENKNAIYEIISILMYITMFKTNKERVSIKVHEAKKHKKKLIPKHAVNVINLFQPLAKECCINGTTKNFLKKWIVRGHWRNQYYKIKDENMPKWIDPYWKGLENKEQAEKIYKI